MSKDTIFRQDAIDAFWSLDVEIRPSAIDAILNSLNGLPSAEPEPPEYCIDCPTFRKTQLLIPPRKKGKWIQNDNGTYSCSLCQAWIPKEQHYYARFCLYCGAQMEEEECPN